MVGLIMPEKLEKYHGKPWKCLEFHLRHELCTLEHLDHNDGWFLNTNFGKVYPTLIPVFLVLKMMYYVCSQICCQENYTCNDSIIHVHGF